MKPIRVEQEAQLSDPMQPSARMRYSLESRCRTVSLILSGLSVAQAAAATGTPRSSAYRWWGRYRAEGWAGLVDRPCVPHRQPRRLPPEVEAEILAVRKRTAEGPQAIGAIVGRAASTVGKVLRRLGHSHPPARACPPL